MLSSGPCVNNRAIRGCGATEEHGALDVAAASRMMRRKRRGKRHRGQSQAGERGKNLEARGPLVAESDSPAASRLQTLLEALLYAEHPPLEPMAELIEIVRAEASLVSRLVKRLREWNRQELMGACWLALVLSETHQAEADKALLDLLIRRREPDEDDLLLDQVLIAGVVRRAEQIFDRMLVELPRRDEDGRGWLYEVLEAVALGEREEQKQELRRFAEERWPIELAARSEHVSSVLELLYLLGDPSVEERWREGLARCAGSAAEADIRDIGDMLRGKLEAAAHVRWILRTDWRETARNIDRLSTPPSRLRMLRVRLMVVRYTISAAVRSAFRRLGLLRD